MTNDVTAQSSITKEELSRLQQEGDSLKKSLDLTEATKDHDYEVKYEKPLSFFNRI